MGPRDRTIDWQLSDERTAPYQARVDGQEWRIRVNDFPRVRHLYTLLIDGQAVEEFTDWPASWTRPPLPGTEGTPEPVVPKPVDENQKDEYERAIEQFERTKNIPSYKPPAKK